MFRILAGRGSKLVFLLVLITIGSGAQAQNDTVKGIWDPQKYISIDEIKPGMDAYCLTVYEGTNIEKFDLVVLDVVRGLQPGRNAILVKGTDERFIHTGPVAGCSGSPVYIDGRLAGALAFGWFFSKDPLYGVTPIAEMLPVGQQPQNTDDASNSHAPAFDFSRPLDLEQIAEQIANPAPLSASATNGLSVLPSPLVTSGLHPDVFDQLDSIMAPYGFMPVAGAGTSSYTSNQNINLSPGSCLSVPLATGDIRLEIIGTVTEVRGKEVYGFGHSFLGYGKTELPMATGRVHTIVSTLMRSFKLGSSIEIVGALTSDESTAVHGIIGQQASMIPLTIQVERYNDPQTRIYNCTVANNRILTPVLFRICVAGAALVRGNLPPDHSIEYEATIAVKDARTLTFRNVSTGVSVADLVTEISAVTAILMNNPYKELDIESVDVKINIIPESIASRLWSVEIVDSKLKPSEVVKLAVTVETFRSEKTKYNLTLKIPENLPPGKYDLLVCGGKTYLQFLRKTTPFKFIPQNLTELTDALNNILQVKRDKIYCILMLPAGGVTLESAELPDLPPTKMLILQDTKRTLRSFPYRRWIEKNITTGTIILDQKVMKLTVEK